MLLLLRSIGTLLLTLCVHSLVFCQDRPTEKLAVLKFDPGPVGSQVEKGAWELPTDALYETELGFGWTECPEKEFVHKHLNRSRSETTIDGVSGERVGFRADVSPGTWQVTIWLGIGAIDNDFPTVILQNQRQSLPWQEFSPLAEPPAQPSKIYRVFHGIAKAESEGLSFELIGTEEDVRLLGISLIKREQEDNQVSHRFRQSLHQLGSHRSTKSLRGFIRQKEAFHDKRNSEPGYASWRQRIELLAQAEEYYKMRGWHWAREETGLGMFDRHHQAVMLLDGVLSPSFNEAGPLAERALFLRGKLLYWLGKERGGQQEIAAARRDLQTLAKRHPEDDVLAMYLGRRMDQPDPCDCLQISPNAPRWSVVQLETLCRLRQLVRWWVNQQDCQSGELGGKLGDDVELLRWWAPLCLVGDETALRGWQNLADGVWHSEHVVDGYAGKVSDVEHASELIADTAPLMVVYRDDDCYAERLKQTADLFEFQWTGRTVKGNRLFRSTWFSSSDVETREPKGRDVEYNTRAVRAMRYLTWRYPDHRITHLLQEWSESWVEFSMRTDKGKPRGIIPASVRFPDEAFNGDEQDWYNANMHWDYYQWEHLAGSLMLDQLFFTYLLTNEKNLLWPLFQTLELVRTEEPTLKGAERGTLKRGSRAWVAERLLRCQAFWNVVEQWRSHSNNCKWDDLILSYGSPYGRYRITGDEQHLVEGLNVLLEDVRYNEPMKTSEALYTDRVYIKNWELLKAMLTGDGVYNNISPYFRVTWEQTDENFTALVSETGRNTLEVQLYSHAPQKSKLVMRLWRLEAGHYRLLSQSQDGPSHVRTIAVELAGQRVPLELPPQQLTRITLQQVPSE